MSYQDFDLHAPSGIAALLSYAWNRPGQKEIWDLRGAKLVGIIDARMPYQQGPRISPDGRGLAFFGAPTLYLAELPDGPVKAILQDFGGHTGFCEWSPEGKRLAFTSQIDDDPPSVFIMEPYSDAKPVQITSGPCCDRFPQWSPCGRYLTFLRQHLNEARVPEWVYVVDVESREAFPVPRPAGAESRTGRFCWSPDSSHILVHRSNEERCFSTVVHRLADMEEVWLYESEEPCPGVFSPDGMKVLLATKSELLWLSFPEKDVLARVSLEDTGLVIQQATGPTVAFDPAGDRCYFLTRSGLYCWEIGGGCSLVLPMPDESKPPHTTERYHLTSGDGFSFPVDRYVPADPKAVAVLLVHGGPQHELRTRQNLRLEIPTKAQSLALHLLSQGYEVIEPMYRSVRGEYGVSELEDILCCACHWKQKQGEGRPLALVGYSYGGYLTALALMIDDAPWYCGATVSSCVEIADIPLHVDAAFPSEPSSRAAAMRERSVIEQVSRISRPMLMFDDVADRRKFLIRDNLLTRGIESDLIIYENDGHSLPLNSGDAATKMSAFFERHRQHEKHRDW